MKTELAILLILVLSIMLAVYLSPQKRPASREGYGPPPGWYRALSHYELDDRGWPEWDKAYEGSSASAVSHMIERSA